MKRLERLACGVAAALLLSGCGAAAPTMTPATQQAATPSIPADGKALSLRYAPAGLSVPETAIIEQQVDQVNNITLVFAAPTGAELAAYYRKVLPTMGFTITADRNNSLLFENAQWQGAFTASGSTCAITFRTDWER